MKVGALNVQVLGAFGMVTYHWKKISPSCGGSSSTFSIFSGPGALSLVSWEDLDVAASLVNADEKKDTLPGEVTDATPTGLYALLVRPEVFAKTNWAVRWKSEPLGRALAYKVTTLSWDGREFKVAIKSGELKPGDRQIAL